VTLGPVAEIVAVVAANLCVAWLAAYAIHSTLLVAAAAAVDRWARLAAADRAALWRLALVGPCLTSVAQVIVRASGGGSGDGAASAVTGALAGALGTRPGLAVGIVAASTTLLPAAAALALLGAWRLRRALGRRAPAQHGDVALLAKLTSGRKSVRLTTSARVPAPAAIGAGEICLPETHFASLGAAEREALLAHELAHLVRRDPVWLALGTLVARVLPFQPLNRVALRRLRDATEHAADDWAVRRTGDPLALARALGALAALLVRAPVGTSAAGGTLVGRVERLVRAPRRAVALPRAARLALGAAALGVALLAPGLDVSGDRAANAIPWNAPSRDEPNARMLEVRAWERAQRDRWRDRWRVRPTAEAELEQAIELEVVEAYANPR
jgi:Zn-dependent protease with chaperone function